MGGYTPIVAQWDTVGLGGSLATSTAAGDDDAALSAVGLLSVGSVNRTWTVAPGGLAADPVEMTVTYLPGDLDPLANSASLLAVVTEAGSSTLPNVVQRTATSATVALAAVPTGTFALGMPSANLSVTIGGPTDALAGEPYQALITATNLGAFGGTASVTIELDPGTTLVSATPSQGSCAPSGSSVVCSLGPIATGAIANVDLVVSFSTAGAHQVVARIAAALSTVDPDASNDIATLEVVLSVSPAPTPEPSPLVTPQPMSPPDRGELPDTAGSLELSGVAKLTIGVLAGLALIALLRVRPRPRHR
jgi:hypothetical protein